MSIPSPQPTTHMLPWPVTTPPPRHNHRTTLQPSKNPCHKTHNPQPHSPRPSCHHCHDQAISTASPPSREIGRESPDLMREVWVCRERVDETQLTTIHDPRLPSPSRWWRWRQTTEKRKKWEWERKKRKGRSEKGERERVTVKRKIIMRYFY